MNKNFVLEEVYEELDFIQKKEKKEITINITKIQKHIPKFDFNEETIDKNE